MVNCTHEAEWFVCGLEFLRTERLTFVLLVFGPAVQSLQRVLSHLISRLCFVEGQYVISTQCPIWLKDWGADNQQTGLSVLS